MKVVTVGSRVFVTSFQLAGVQGKIVDSSDNAFEEIKKLYDDSEVGLVLVSDDLTEQINGQFKQDAIINLRINEVKSYSPSQSIYSFTIQLNLSP